MSIKECVDLCFTGMYVLSGILSILTGVYILKDPKHTKKIGSALFWISLGIIIALGPYLPSYVVGGVLVFMGVLTALKKVGAGSLKNADESHRRAKFKKIGNKLFIPAFSIGIITYIIMKTTPLGGIIGMVIAMFITLFITLYITKEKASYIGYDTARYTQLMGPVTLLPQLLSALGAIFTSAGVGKVLAGYIEHVVPHGSILGGVIAYCLGMAIFTIIMGNAYAAYAVITAGIGIPFVFAQGADPSIAGMLGLTAGYCGTLMTPMAANFNLVPASIMEMKDKNGVLKAQIPLALILLAAHIVIMYFYAF